MVPQPADEISYEMMVERLFPDFQAAMPLWPVHKRLALWLGLEFGVLFVGLTVHRPDLPQRIHDIRYLLQLGLFVSMGTAAAVLALKTAIPGREANRKEVSLVLAVALTAIALIAYEPSVAHVSLVQFVRIGIRCTIFTGIIAAVPWIALFGQCAEELLWQRGRRAR